MHQNSHRPSRRDILASATDSLNRSRCVQNSNKQTSPQNIPGVRSSISTSCLVSSPNHSRRQGQGQGGSVTSTGTRSTHGSRTGSPLTVTMPIENLQSINAAYSMSQTYLAEGLGNAIPSPNSPVYISSSPGHSRSNSVQSLLRGERDHYSSGRTSMDRSVYSDRHTGYMRDRSLDRRDRSLDRRDRSHNRQNDMMERYNTYSGRERSLDREYVPHMGARSLEREHSNLVRSRSIDHEYINDQAVFFPSAPESYHSKDTLILDLQTHIAQLNKECSLMRKDLESTKDKLSSSMNSIKTFWSPELKKERAMRKEESAKHQMFQDQIRLHQAESQTQKSTIELLERQLKDAPSPGFHHPATTGDSSTDSMRRQTDRLVKEIAILRKTVEEMEIRIDTQKQTLCARDESIKKLLEMLQSKGLAVKQLEEDRIDLEQLRTRVGEDGRQIKQLEGLLESKDRDISQLTQELQPKRTSLDLSGDNASLQALLQTKDLQIESLEMELRRQAQDGAGQEVSQGRLETLESQEKLLKTKLDNVKAELAQKHTELCSLRTRVEMWEKQEADHQQHICVLREQITAKEQQGTMLQTDVVSLQERLKEKDEMIRQKGQQLVATQNDKKRVDLELSELRDHLNIREHKLNMLQKKVENLEETMKDKEDEVTAMKIKLSSVSANQNSVDSLVDGLQDSLNSKEKQIERLKEQRERSDVDHQEELAKCEATIRETKNRTADLQSQLDETQAAVLERQDELSELKSEKRSCESAVSQLQVALSQKSAEVTRLNQLVEQRAAESSETKAETKKRLSLLEDQQHKSEAAAAQAQKEVDRLLLILQESETEKNKLEEQIQEQQKQLKELRQKMGTLKHSQQTEKTKSAQLLEEARKREDSLGSDSSQLKTLIKQYEDRVEELEEALRESVKITAQREMVMAEQHVNIEQQDKQARGVSEELERLRQSSVEHGEQVTAMESILEDRDASLQRMQAERTDQLKELYEMKQEAIVAAISEKDAHIALLEMTPNSNQYNIEAVEKLTQEKIQLQKQLSEVTQKRMKLIQHTGEDPKSPTDGMSRIPVKKSPKKQKNSRKQPEGAGSGIWT